MAKVKKMVEYKLWLNDKGEKIIPPHISDGGYYLESNGKMIGILEVDDDVYISPTAFTEITKSELITRVENLRKNEDIEIGFGFKRLTVSEEIDIFMLKLN